MKDILNNSMFFGVLVSILAYEVGVLLKKKFKFALLNPLLISIIINMEPYQDQNNDHDRNQ